jgi:hypothetical protein
MARAMNDQSLEHSLLEAVRLHGECLTQRILSETVGRSLSSVNFSLRLLAAKGFIKISGTGPRKQRYHLTPQGVLQKSLLAYSFLRRQTALYEEVRQQILATIVEIRDDGVKSAGVFGWTPFTETAVLHMLLNGIKAVAIYVEQPKAMDHRSSIPFRLIDDFEPDCDVMVLMEPLPERFAPGVVIRKVACFPSDLIV